MAHDDPSQKLFEEMCQDSLPQPTAETSGTTASNKVHGQVVLERLGNGVRITGQDSRQQLLWGMVASKATIEQPHCAVAVYSRLREIVSDTLAAEGLPAPSQIDVVAAAKQSLADLREITDLLLQRLNVKRETAPTIRRATVIHRAISDALNMIRQETTLVTQGRELGDLD